MFGWFEIESPLTTEQREWIDVRFAWLRREFGEKPLHRELITPTVEFFPDRYTASPEGAAMLLDRLCGYMHVERSRIDLRLYKDPAADRFAVPSNPLMQTEYALGACEVTGGRSVIWLEQSSLDEPHSVVSTLAHELGHVLLLADGRCDESTPDSERLTDLLAVYFGLGVFMANTAIRETKSPSGRSPSQQGYLTMPEYACALALYAHSRGEFQPDWTKYLRPDARAMFKTEAKLLASGRPGSRNGLDNKVSTKSDGLSAVEPPCASGLPENVHKDSGSELDDQTNEVEDSAEENPLFSESPDAYFAQGEFYSADGDYELAVEAYSRALELDAGDSEAWLNRARLQLVLEQFSKAVDDCSESLRYDPDAVSALCCRGHANICLERYAKALPDLDEALRLEKYDSQIYLLRGLALLGLGEHERALVDVNDAVRCNPVWADNYLVRSRIYAAMGKTNEAEADLAEAIRRNLALADSATREARSAGKTWR